MTQVERQKQIRVCGMYCWLSRVALGLICFGVALLYFWAFDTRPPVTIDKAFPIKATFFPDEKIVIQEHVIAHRACPGEISRFIIDEKNIAYTIFYPTDPLLFRQSPTVRIEFDIPETANGTHMRYRSEATWHCNPLRTFTQQIADVPFIIDRSMEVK